MSEDAKDSGELREVLHISRGVRGGKGHKNAVWNVKMAQDTKSGEGFIKSSDSGYYLEFGAGDYPTGTIVKVFVPA